MLGTGSAMVTKCYNTCFTLSNDSENLLVDGGGGNTILTNLEKCNISINSIHNVFLSHNHNDHILGIIWVIRKVCQEILKDKYDGNLNIYCQQISIDALRDISSYVLQKKFINLFDKRIIFNKVEDNMQATILGRKTIFFDIQSTKDPQFGFKTYLNNGKTLTFLGDEPYRDSVKKYAQNVDILMHEAFCTYEDREIFKPYEKHHATSLDACKNASLLNVKSIILFHGEGRNLSDRKIRYIDEGKTVFKGTIYAPDDLDEIIL